MSTRIQPDTLIIPRPRVCDVDLPAEPQRAQAGPGDIDDRGYVLAFSNADDMGVWLAPDEAANLP